MQQTRLIRYSGVAAILAGALRGIASFVPSTAAGVTALYFVTDLAILAALIGLYAWLCKLVGRWERGGLLLALLGVSILLLHDLIPAWAVLYPVGALALALGLCALAIGVWQTHKLPRWIPAFWLLSTGIGIAGFFGPGLTPLFVISGVIFGLSFVGAGVQMWRVSAHRQPI